MSIRSCSKKNDKSLLWPGITFSFVVVVIKWYSVFREDFYKIVPIRSYVKLCPAMEAILDFRPMLKCRLYKEHSIQCMLQFGFNQVYRFSWKRNLLDILLGPMLNYLPGGRYLRIYFKNSLFIKSCVKLGCSGDHLGFFINKELQVCI